MRGRSRAAPYQFPGRYRIIDTKEKWTMSKPGTAAVLSLFIPGVGQIYNGAIWRGIFWLIITPGFWIGTGGLLGWVCHLISAYTAYSYAKKAEALITWPK
jgi:TM2 domain-containing membrane protein YozV